MICLKSLGTCSWITCQNLYGLADLFIYPSRTMEGIWNPSMTFYRKQSAAPQSLSFSITLHIKPPLLIKGLSHGCESSLPIASHPSQNCRGLLEEALHLCPSPFLPVFSIVMRSVAMERNLVASSDGSH